MLFLNNVCEQSSFLKSLYFIKELIKYTCILLPIGLIIMVSIDLMRSVTSKEEEMSKNIKMAGKRILYCIIVFLIPTIVNLTVSILNNADISINYNECLTNANLSTIKGLEETEEYEKEDEYTTKAPTDPQSDRKIVNDKSKTSKTESDDDDDDDFDDSDAPSDGAQRMLYYAEKFYQKVEKDGKNGKKWKHCSQESGKPCTTCCKLVNKILIQAGLQKKGTKMVCHVGGSHKPTNLDSLSNKKVYKLKNQRPSDLKPGDVIVYSSSGSSAGNIAIFAKKKNGNYYFYGASSGSEIRGKSHPRKSTYWLHNGRPGKLYIIRAKK